ncbi:hypothetical protein LZK98_01615 [Sphingomonas cannabina]|uniref:hypothetical protein n=1 Tax=Sphingomonas cannabina TaxID=2899123 RepID=UPI001F44F30B|nr:hypothetical protein [Sphingomonas cannabina]UIJ45687.1 hypothetical protein LZK98_01615 [Sphingomonas cannabina]
MKALDWLGRVALLVLSVLATLSLVGSLASVSGGRLGDAVPGRVGAPMPVVEEASRPAPLETGGASGVPDLVDGTAPTGTVAAERPRAEDEIARWLKALTYAVLALAGFAAAGLLALLRITAHLARIADR